MRHGSIGLGGVLFGFLVCSMFALACSMFARAGSAIAWALPCLAQFVRCSCLVSVPDVCLFGLLVSCQFSCRGCLLLFGFGSVGFVFAVASFLMFALACFCCCYCCCCCCCCWSLLVLLLLSWAGALVVENCDWWLN